MRLTAVAAAALLVGLPLSTVTGVALDAAAGVDLEAAGLEVSLSDLDLFGGGAAVAEATVLEPAALAPAVFFTLGAVLASAVISTSYSAIKFCISVRRLLMTRRHWVRQALRFLSAGRQQRVGQGATNVIWRSRRWRSFLCFFEKGGKLGVHGCLFQNAVITKNSFC